HWQKNQRNDGQKYYRDRAHISSLLRFCRGAHQGTRFIHPDERNVATNPACGLIWLNAPLLLDADSHRRPWLTPPDVQALAHPGARLQDNPPFVSGLSAMARFRLRVRARRARHRCHQWWFVAARMGG